MYEYPERKRYIYTIPTKKGDLVLRFSQATAEETKDNDELSKRLADPDPIKRMEALRDLWEYYVNFIKKASNFKRYQFRKRAMINEVLLDIDEYITPILAMVHKLWHSLYLNYDIPKIDGQKPRPTLFENIAETIFKKTGVSVDKIYQTFTAEQIGRYTDKAIFQSFETFKEGKEINDKVNRGLNKNKGWLSPEDQADLDIILAQKWLSTQK